MAITIELSPDLEEELRVEAQCKGITLDALAIYYVHMARNLSSPTRSEMKGALGPELTTPIPTPGLPDFKSETRRRHPARGILKHLAGGGTEQYIAEKLRDKEREDRPL